METALQITGTAAVIQAQELTDALAAQFISFIDAAPQSVAIYRAGTRKLLDWLSSKGITQPRRDDVLAYRDELKANYKPTTVSLYMTAARLFFRWTDQQGFYPNIADNVKGAKLDREHKKECLTSHAVKDVLQAAKGDTLAGLRDYAILALMTTCGLRCIEVTRANIEDLRTVAAENTLAPALYLQGKGREEKTDFAKLPPQVAQAINAYLKARGKADSKAPLFASISNNSKGQRLTTRSVSRLVKGHLVAAGYDRATMTAHSLRHTAATLALLNGETLGQVQKMLRHANINTTMIYEHAIERAKSTCEYTVANAIFD
jgi:integrase/recombinase XerD